MNRHRRVAQIGCGQIALREAGFVEIHTVRPCPELGFWMMRHLAFRLVGEQQLHDHFARGAGALGRGHDLHPGRRLTDAGGGEHALALDLDHAGAAVAIGPVAGLGQPAQMRNVDAFARRHLPDGLARLRPDLAAIQGELDRVGHDVNLARRAKSRLDTAAAGAFL